MSDNKDNKPEENKPDEHKLIAQRREHLEALRKSGQAYPNDFRRDSLADDLHQTHAESDKETLESVGMRVNVAGRMMTRRVMGKASFAHIQDMSGKIQLYVRRDDIPEENKPDEHKLIAQRREQLEALRKSGQAYPNDFRRDSLADDLHQTHAESDKETLESVGIRVNVAGRMMTRRVMGKASFAHIQDMSGKIQLYVRRDDLPEGLYADFKQWDLGDIIGAEGQLMKTNKGELSVHVDNVRLLT